MKNGSGSEEKGMEKAEKEKLLRTQIEAEKFNYDSVKDALAFGFPLMVTIILATASIRYAYSSEIGNVWLFNVAIFFEGVGFSVMLWKVGNILGRKKKSISSNYKKLEELLTKQHSKEKGRK